MRHKHAEVIKAWADGAEIEFRRTDKFSTSDNWEESTNPQWFENTEYRVKDIYKELKEAYAAGKIIQLLRTGQWEDTFNPDWTAHVSKYRVKPKQGVFVSSKYCISKTAHPSNHLEVRLEAHEVISTPYVAGAGSIIFTFEGNQLVDIELVK